MSIPRLAAIAAIAGAGLVAAVGPGWSILPTAGPAAHDSGDAQAAGFKTYPCAPAVDVVDERAVGQAGGNLRAGRHRVVVPRDALPGRRRLTLREHRGDYLVVSLHPPGQSFRRSVEIVLSTHRCGPQTEEPRGAIRFTPSTGWVRVDASRVSVQPGAEPGEFEVTIRAEGFSSYALIAP
jgi:hypothetical protein